MKLEIIVHVLLFAIIASRVPHRWLIDPENNNFSDNLFLCFQLYKSNHQLQAAVKHTSCWMFAKRHSTFNQIAQHLLLIYHDIIKLIKGISFISSHC